jgi:MoaA/NifB/PqqE/SkfB family radical SAM enzyme
MACNFKCKYCWEVQGQEHGDFKPEPFKPWRTWADAWVRLRPDILDITGGEPFLVPGLLDIIEAVTAAGTRVAITTNLSHPILEFVKRITPEQVFSITASYHPTENGDRKNPMNADVFFGRLLLLREFGFNEVTVNIVTWPEQLWLIPKYIEMCETHRFRWHVDPYTSIMYYPWTYTEAEKAALSQWITPQRVPWEAPGGPVTCSGGIDHLSVQPDGSAWRCILERQQFVNPLGNILDPDFTLLADGLRCDQSHNCPGCDRDKVTIHPLTLPTA